MNKPRFMKTKRASAEVVPPGARRLPATRCGAANCCCLASSVAPAFSELVGPRPHLASTSSSTTPPFPRTYRTLKGSMAQEVLLKPTLHVEVCLNVTNVTAKQQQEVCTVLSNSASISLITYRYAKLSVSVFARTSVNVRSGKTSLVSVSLFRPWRAVYF